MEQRISLVTLGVRDLGRARAFYEALGWSGAQQPDDEVAFYQAGGMIFGLWAALGGHGAPGIELAHNVPSPTRKAMCGRSPTIPAGNSPATAPSGSVSAARSAPVRPARAWRRSEHLVPEHVGAGQR